VLEIEVLVQDGPGYSSQPSPAPGAERPARAALQAVGVDDAHVAIAFVDEEEIRRLNREHRGLDEPTDVLSFPVDETGVAAGPRELGDVLICRRHTADLTEAVVHGVLHLCGYDHETDDGEMLAMQARVLERL
jgi:probable rRNA maturation factor